MTGFKSTRYLALMLGLGAALGAQTTGLEYGYKVGVGRSFTKGDQQNFGSMHLALQGKKQLSEGSWLIGEVGYRYFRADEWDNTPNGIVTGYVPGGGTGDIARQSSVAIHKADLDGLFLSAGYRSQINAKWAWHAGLNLHMLKSTIQVVGEYNTMKPGTATLVTFSTANRLYREGMSVVTSKNAVKPGVFAGLTGAITKDVFAEVNLMTVGHTQITYVPFATTGTAAHTETSNKSKAMLEVSLGFKF